MLVGLTGSFGAGKGAVVDYLVKEKGFKHYSARSLIREEVEKQNILVNRDSLIDMGNQLRKEHGPAYIAAELSRRAAKSNKNAVIESLRAKAEAEYVKENNGVVIGIDADPEVRYQRAVKRGSETDSVSYEKWQEQQRVETNPNDPTKQDIYGALNESDYIIMNNGSLEELHSEIEKALSILE